MPEFARQHYRSNLRKLLALILALVIALGLSLCAGDLWIGPEAWFTPRGELFIWQIRLPRTLAVVLVGAALALSGTIMQALFDNPLAEPGLLGVSNGAGVGLIAAVMLGGGAMSGWSLSLCAIAGALIITLILLRFARRHLSVSRLLLAGVALGIICSALMTWAVYFSTAFDLRQLMYWMMGGFGGVDWGQGWLMLLLLPAIVCAGRDFGPPARPAAHLLAQHAGGRHRLDGGCERGPGRCDWLYRPCHSPYATFVWYYRSPAVIACCGGNRRRSVAFR